MFSIRQFTGRLAAMLALFFAMACGGSTDEPETKGLPKLATCGTSKALFTAIPLDVAQIMGWVPLGSVNPPPHTFPTDHQYIYLQSFPNAQPIPLYAPGKITITRARKVTYSTGGVPDDYSIDFMPCAEVSANFGHVRTIAASLLSRMGAFDQQCESYSPNPGLTVSTCFAKPLEIEMQAGEVIGTSAGLDLTLFDRRIAALEYANNARWSNDNSDFDHFHVVPFSDYFAEPSRTTVRSLLGSFDGRTRRTIEPLGGTIASDVAGSAQGVWFNPTAPTYPESPHLAFIPDHVDPLQYLFSVGTSQPGLPPGVYRFTATASGQTNRAPATVTAGPTIYCYAIGTGPSDPRGVLLVQLPTAGSLVIEARAGANRTCVGEQPWAFTASAFTYVR